jgi:preprotein translocase subunit YajC
MAQFSPGGNLAFTFVIGARSLFVPNLPIYSDYSMTSVTRLLSRAGAFAAGTAVILASGMIGSVSAFADDASTTPATVTTASSTDASTTSSMTSSSTDMSTASSTTSTATTTTTVGGSVWYASRTNCPCYAYLL